MAMNPLFNVREVVWATAQVSEPDLNQWDLSSLVALERHWLGMGWTQPGNRVEGKSGG